MVPRNWRRDTDGVRMPSCYASARYHPFAMIDAPESPARRINSPAQVLFASLIGTTIEFFDFYIYATIGIAAPLLLAVCRFGQGLGLGGEWGGAVLLAVENAPPGKRAWYGMFPQLGAPIGFLFSGGVFLILSAWLSDEKFFSFGWRLPFLASAVLVVLGLYVRLTIVETPVIREAMTRHERVRLPMLAVLRDY